MARAWLSIDSAQTPDGVLELRRRAADDFLMTIDGRVLMSSAARRSEETLGQLAAEATKRSPSPRVLIAGLGMGHTLRAALDVLPENARVEVAEINPVVARWSLEELAELNGSAAQDPRVSLEIADVAEVIRKSADRKSTKRFDAILLDLYVGPAASISAGDPFYGAEALRNTHSALRAGGVLGVWSESSSEDFERGLIHAGFEVECRRVGRGGRRHAVYVGRSPTG